MKLESENSNDIVNNIETEPTDDAELLYHELIDSIDVIDDGIEIYNYPIRPGMEEWTSLKTTTAIHSALQIPEKILYGMSTRNLVNTVLDYPLFVTDLLSFGDLGNPFSAIDHIENTFNGLSELLQRKDVGTELLIKYKEMDVEGIIQLFDADQYRSFEMGSQLTATELLLAHKLVQNKLTEKEIIILNDAVAKNLEAKTKTQKGLFGLSISTYEDAIYYNKSVSSSK